MPTAKADAKVIAVMPAQDAARTLEKTLSAIPRDWVDGLILVDDASTGDAVALARRIPSLHVLWHPHDAGYGGNQKTCLLEALRQDADVVVMLHPDGEYEPLLIPKLVAPILEDRADLVLGSRFLTPGAARHGGMSRSTWAVNRALTTVANALLGTHFSELQARYRAYSRRLLLEVPWLRNNLDLSFDSQLLLQAVNFGFRIQEVPASTIPTHHDSDVSRREGIAYGTRTLAAAATLVAHRHHFWRSRSYLP
jgi:glycosyltransferase involved in cell wall biosynthesis